MKVVSLNVGRPREVEWRGKPVLTSIFKVPVEGRRHVTRLNVDGDQQSDLSVHGGVDKAVYAYPSEHYPYWRERLARELPWGAFGENLTVAGLLEADVRIGDRFRIGSAELFATQPRTPCFKLGIRHDRPEIVKEFLQSRRSGFYLAVAVEGDLGTGDAIEHLSRDDGALTVAEMNELYGTRSDDVALLRRALAMPALAAVWKEEIEERLGRLETGRPLDGD
jgi:MOSC domain-containing protein YiiM